jgi:D-glycero-D-manno-heptose 1,7-bisphosphate phosphatase
MASGRPALFLDRDGVINVDHGYVHRVEDFEFVPGIFELARFAVQDLCWPIVVVTNQAGIGRGFFDEASFQRLTRWMCDRFATEAAPITKVYHCPYHPEHGVGDYRRDHPWRKPKPGMLFQAAADLNLDLAQSAFTGDKMSDIECANAAGIGLRIMIDPSAVSPAGSVTGYEVARDLAQVLDLLRKYRAMLRGMS